MFVMDKLLIAAPGEKKKQKTKNPTPKTNVAVVNGLPVTKHLILYNNIFL